MNMSIAQKFVCILVLLLLISSGTIYFVSTSNYSQALNVTLHENIREAQNNFVAITTASKNEFLHVSKVSSNYNGLASAVVNNDVTRLADIAKTIMNQAEVSIVTITDVKGTVLLRGHADKKGDSIISQRTITQALRGIASSDLVMGAQEPFSLRASAPIMQDGAVVGTISLGNTLSNPAFIDWLGNFLNVSVTFFNDDTRVMTTIKDAHGKRIIGTRLEETTIKNQVLSEGKTFFGSSTVYGTEYLASYWPARTNDNEIIGMWFIGLPIQDALKLEQEANQNTLLAASIVLAIMLLLAVFVGLGFAKPIKTLAAYASKIAEGKSDTPLHMNRTDEFGVLANSLKDMVEKLKEQANWYESILNCIPSPLAAMDINRNFMFVNSGVCNMLGKKPQDLLGLPCYNWGASICRTENCAIDSCERGIKDVNFEQPGLGHFKAMAARLYDTKGDHVGYVDMVFDRNQEVQLLNEAEKALVDGRHGAANQLDSIVETIARVAEQLNAQIDISSQGAETAAMRMTETATAMDEMNSTVLEIARNSNTSANIAEETKQKATEGTRTIKQSEETMLRLRENSIEIRTSMGELAEHAQSISTVMGVISDIADQTNLLALNAAIEAARAGEAGRGFAVVADEVRKLAEKTMASTADVSRAIAAIQQSTEINVRHIDTTVKRIEEAAELATANGEALNGILIMAEESADGVRAIATASEEQSATSDEITQAILTVSTIVNDTTNAMLEATQAVNALSEQSQQLSNLIEELKA